MAATVPTIYDINETAAKLRVTRRFLVGWLRKHPSDDSGQPFVSAVAGRKKLFTEAAIVRIFAAMAPEPMPALSNFVPRRNTRLTVSGGRSSLEEALALVREKTRKSSSSNEPNVVPMRGRKRRLSPPQS